jgi:hypothetical protein
VKTLNVGPGGVRNFCFDACDHIGAVDRGDCADVVDHVLDRVIHALHRDPAIPQRSYDAWRLFFADVRVGAEDLLDEQFAGLADLNRVVDAIADALGNELLQRKRKSKSERAEASP